MKHAIFETGGKQYRAKEGDIIMVERLPEQPDGKVTFDNVLAILDETSFMVGAPYVKGATVGANVVKNGKAKKITVYKMHPKKGYHRKQGHRQPYTKVEIKKINA